MLGSALEAISGADYFRAVEARFLEGKRDIDIAYELYYAERTVCRQRGQLIRRMAIRLYGVAAI